MIEKEALQVLDGLMLGDGNLRRFPSGAIYHMCQCKHTISIEDHLKWLEWLRDNVFAALCIRAAVKPYWGTYSKGAKKGQKFQFASLSTELSVLLTEVYGEWYIGGEFVTRRDPGHHLHYIRGATKAIPGRLMNASELLVYPLVHWFLGDGGSSWRHSRVGTLYPTASFSTQCFTGEEVYHLIDMLNNMEIKTVKPSKRRTRKGSGLQIRLAQDGINNLMTLIEPHILEIFGDSEGPSYKDMIKYKPTR